MDQQLRRLGQARPRDHEVSVARMGSRKPKALRREGLRRPQARQRQERLVHPPDGELVGRVGGEAKPGILRQPVERMAVIVIALPDGVFQRRSAQLELDVRGLDLPSLRIPQDDRQPAGLVVGVPLAELLQLHLDPPIGAPALSFAGRPSRGRAAPPRRRASTHPDHEHGHEDHGEACRDDREKSHPVLRTRAWQGSPTPSASTRAPRGR